MCCFGIHQDAQFGSHRIGQSGRVMCNDGTHNIRRLWICLESYWLIGTKHYTIIDGQYRDNDRNAKYLHKIPLWIFGCGAVTLWFDMNVILGTPRSDLIKVEKDQATIQCRWNDSYTTNGADQGTVDGQRLLTDGPEGHHRTKYHWQTYRGDTEWFHHCSSNNTRINDVFM